eukprot:4487328-Pleurochrysis_carterae.AAC.1
MAEPSTISKPSWDSSQLTECACLHDLFRWIPTCNSLYATLIEQGYSLTPQGRVVVYSSDHAKAVFHRLHQTHTFDSPSPVAPTFVFPRAPAPPPASSQSTSDRTLRSGTQVAAQPAAAPPAQPPSQLYRDLTTAELDHYVVSPETLINLDRQLMESVPSTIESPATRAAYRARCNNSGRLLLRLLVAEADRSSASAGLAIESMMEALLVKGLAEPSLTDFNELHHSFTRHRSLPPHSRLSDNLIDEKLASVVRLLNESLSTLLDVKLELKSAAGDLPRTLEAIRDVLSTAQAREFQRNLELERPNGRALLAESKFKHKLPRKPKKAGAGNGSKGDPKRATADSQQWHEKAGPCRHCGGRHWHRDCPRRKPDSRDKGTGQAALATDVDATNAAIGEALFSNGAGGNTVEFTTGTGGTALCVRGVSSTARATSDNASTIGAAADLLAHEKYLAASELRAQDEREHARLFPTSESDDVDSQ